MLRTAQSWKNVLHRTRTEEVLERWLPRTAKRAPVLGRYQQWLDLKWAQVDAGDRSPNTIREYQRYARPGGELEWWKGHSVYDINYASLEDWNAWLQRRKVSAAPRRKIFGAFRTFVGWQVKRGTLPTVPQFPELPTNDHEPTTITEAEQWEILETLPDDRRGLFLALALLGLRPGEARALDIADLYERDGALWVRVIHAMQGPAWNAKRGPTKTRRQRTLPVPPELEEWIGRHVDPANRLQGAPLFLHPRIRRRWGHWSVRDTWLAAAREVGINVGLYEGTKHSRATQWLEDGVPARTIQDVLGHSDVRSTRRYARLGKGALVELAGRHRKRQFVCGVCAAKSRC